MARGPRVDVAARAPESHCVGGPDDRRSHEVRRQRPPAGQARGPVASGRSRSAGDRSSKRDVMGDGDDPSAGGGAAGVTVEPRDRVRAGASLGQQTVQDGVEAGADRVVHHHAAAGDRLEVQPDLADQSGQAQAADVAQNAAGSASGPITRSPAAGDRSTSRRTCRPNEPARAVVLAVDVRGDRPADGGQRRTGEHRQDPALRHDGPQHLAQGDAGADVDPRATESVGRARGGRHVHGADAAVRRGDHATGTVQRRVRVALPGATDREPARAGVSDGALPLLVRARRRQRAQRRQAPPEVRDPLRHPPRLCGCRRHGTATCTSARRISAGRDRRTALLRID